MTLFPFPDPQGCHSNRFVSPVNAPASSSGSGGTSWRPRCWDRAFGGTWPRRRDPHRKKRRSRLRGREHMNGRRWSRLLPWSWWQWLVWRRAFSPWAAAASRPPLPLWIMAKNQESDIKTKYDFGFLDKLSHHNYVIKLHLCNKLRIKGMIPIRSSINLVI